jgi:hypothetical protein
MAFLKVSNGWFSAFKEITTFDRQKGEEKTIDFVDNILLFKCHLSTECGRQNREKNNFTENLL